jgi:hypothetical protein
MHGPLNIKFYKVVNLSLNEVAAIMTTKLCFSFVEIFVSNLNAASDSTPVK